MKKELIDAKLTDGRTLPAIATPPTRAEDRTTMLLRDNEERGSSGASAEENEYNFVSTKAWVTG